MIDRVRNRKPAGDRFVSAGPIPRDLVDKLVESPWYEPYAHLAAVAGAKSLEDLRQLEKGFNRAHRRLKTYVMAAKQFPWDEESGELARRTLRDENLAAGLERLVVTLDHNPVFQDPVPAWAGRMAYKILHLRSLGFVYIRRGTIIHRP